MAHLRLSSVIRIANIAAIADSTSLVSPVSPVLQRALQTRWQNVAAKSFRGVRDFPQAAMIRQIPFQACPRLDCSVRTGVGCVSLISDIPSSSDDLNLAKTGEDYSSGSNAGEVVQRGKQLLSCMWQISTKGRMPSSQSVLDIEFLDHFGYTQPLELLNTYLPFF